MNAANQDAEKEKDEARDPLGIIPPSMLNTKKRNKNNVS